MIRPKPGLKALSLCALVLGLMIFASGNAQAETGAKWRSNSTDIPGIPSDLLPQLKIKEIESKSASLAFTTKGGTSVLVLCTAAEFAEGGKLIADGGISLGRVLLKGCVILLNESAAPNCKPHSSGKPSGEILSERVTGLIVLDKLEGGEVTELVKITPENSKGEAIKLLTEIEMGEFCPIGELVKVETTELGEGLWVKDVGGNAGFLAESTTHLVVEGLSKLLALGQPAKIVGSAVLELAGEHAGMKWSGVPDQAEAEAAWRVNSTDIPGIPSDLLPQLKIKEIESKSASLAFTTKGGTSVLVLCTAAEFAEGGKLIADGGISLGRVLLKGCVILLNESAAPNCKPHSSGKPSGEILSERVTGLIVLDKLEGGEVTELVKITPENSKGEAIKLLTEIEMGEFCPIGELVKVETTELGEGLWVKDVGGNAGFLAESTTHLVVEGLSKLLALGQPAKIVGSAVLELAGEHAGMKWSGVPDQAEAEAAWRVNSTDIPGIPSDLLPQLKIKEIESKSASLAFTTKGGTSVLVLCTAAEFAEGGKLIADGGISLGRVLLKGCVILLNESAAPNCKPHSSGKPSGEILSERVTGLIVLDKLEGGEVTELVKITPENSKGEAIKLLTEIEMGEFCPIGELVKVETTELGEGLWVKDVGGNAGFLAESTTHLVVEGLSKLLALGQPAKIVGSAVLELAGEHAGMKWSGVPA